MALKTFIDVGLTAELTSLLDLQQPAAPGRLRRVLSWADADADLFWADRRTLAPSATEDLDLATGGGLVDAFGQPLAFARVLALIIVAAGGNTNGVQVTRPTAGVPIFMASGDGVEVRPGSPFALVAADGTGYAVTATTADLITFTNSGAGTSVTYDIAIVGKST